MAKKQKPIAIMISIVLIAGLLCNIPSIEALDNTDYGISNPDVKIPSIGLKKAVTTWDCIFFGNYWQNDTNDDGVADQNDDKKPIKWRVLSVDGNNAFLLADQNLDAQPYNQERKKVTWENCTLRNWLNDNFYNAAFTAAEQNAINTTGVDDDKIYVLSDDDLFDKKYGFDEISFFQETRISTNTPYTQACGAYTKDNDIGYWWINNRHNNSDSGDVVNDSNAAYIPKDVDDPTGAVRPCLHIDLSLSTWTKAGTVCSNGDVTDKSIMELSTTTEATTTTQTHVIQVPQVISPTPVYIFPTTTPPQSPKDKTKPTVKGVKNKKTYKKAVTIKFADKQSGIKKATLNGKKIKNGKKVKKNGKYTLRVYDKAGNCTTVKFTVKIKKKK